MNALETAGAWLAEGRKVAIATVIETWGSAPQPVGSQLVVDDAGNFEGAVSGGCVEGDVITAAQEAIGTGAHKLLSYGVADETAWKVGLACGGKIRILVEAVK
jgi:xanthine/CO dehydrogenase XdhC/CoxF family maturation factor